MQKDIRLEAILRRIRHPAFALFFTGAFGLLFGTLLAANADTSVFALMRRVEFSPVSIVMCLAAQLLPFLIAAYAASISRLWLLCASCGCRLFSFAYTGALIWIAYGTAGWLVRLLFLFSDILLVPWLCWFCFRRVIREYEEKKDLCICMGMTVIATLIDCLFISPFMVKIL